MPQVKKTISLDEKTVELLDLLCAEKNITNSSEVLRLLIAEESLRCGIIRSMSELNVPDINFRQQKSDVLIALNEIKTALMKMQHKTNDTEEMCYQIRDGVNTYLNFIEVTTSDSADENILDANIHESLSQSKENYNKKLRQLSIDKRNFRSR